MSANLSNRPVVSDVLHAVLFQVKCDHPTGERMSEFGLNVFLFQGPTAEADARIRSAELLTAGRSNVRISKQEHRKVLRQGCRVARDRWRWSNFA